MNWQGLFYKVFAAMVITSATCFVTTSFAVIGFLGMKIVTLGDNQVTIISELDHMNKSDSKLKDVLSEEIVQLKVQNAQLSNIIKEMSATIEEQQKTIDEIMLSSVDKPPFSVPEPKKNPKSNILFPELSKKPSEKEIEKYRKQLEQKTIPDREIMQMQMKE